MGPLLPVLWDFKGMDGVFLFSCFQWVIALEGTILINSTTISSLLLQKDWIVVCLHDLLKSLLVLVEKRQWSGKPLWGKKCWDISLSWKLSDVPVWEFLFPPWLYQIHKVRIFGLEMAGESIFKMSSTLKKLTKCCLFYTHKLLGGRSANNLNLLDNKSDFLFFFSFFLSSFSLVCLRSLLLMLAKKWLAYNLFEYSYSEENYIYVIVA